MNTGRLVNTGDTVWLWTDDYIAHEITEDVNGAIKGKALEDIPCGARGRVQVKARGNLLERYAKAHKAVTGQEL